MRVCVALILVVLAVAVGAVNGAQLAHTSRSVRVLPPRAMRDVGGTTQLTLQWVKNAGARKALCMDGTPAGYYVGKIDPRETRWVVFLEGGGACLEKLQCEARCIDSGHLCSSKHWSSTMGAQQGILSLDPAVNPDFAGFNQVFVPYCSSDVWSGNVGKADSAWGYNFYGHNIVTTVMEDLMATYNLTGTATELLLTGGSAGGAGTLANCDMVAGMLPNTRTRCNPDAGWFIGFKPYSKPCPRLNSTALYELFNATTNLACEAAVGDKCLNATIVYKYIKTPLFVSESYYDSWQTEHLCLPPDKKGHEYRAEFGAAMRASMAPLLSAAKDGMFVSTCGEHTETLNDKRFTDVRIQGQNLQQTLSNWYFGVGTTKVTDACTDYDCNPTCKDS